VVNATDDSTYERYGRFNVVSSKNRCEPYNETVPELPGSFNIIEYDKGVSGVNYYNATRSLTTALKDGQWMEYTVDVKEDGMYFFDATLASTKAGGMFHLAEYGLDNLSYLTEYVVVPKTGGSSVWKTLHGQLKMELTAGRHVFTLLIDKGGFYLKDIAFTRYEEGEGMSCRLKAFSGTYGVGDVVPVEMKATSKNSPISHVTVYADNILVGTSDVEPYTVNFVPSEMKTYNITAIVTNAEGKVKVSAGRALNVTSPTPVDIVTVKNDVVKSQAYNLNGLKVDDNYRGIVIVNGKKIMKR
jgi:hypothetical protein